LIESLNEIGVVPHGIDHKDLADKLNEISQRLEEEADRDALTYDASRRGRNGRKKKSTMPLEPPGVTRLRWWKKCRDDLIYKITSVPQYEEQERMRANLPSPPSPRYGWLVMWYTDQRLRITGFKLRRVVGGNTKMFVPWRLAEKKFGVFGASLFPADQSATNAVLVVEGEFNLLRLQSLYYEVNGAWENVVATGGATTVDVETIIRCGDNIVVCYDHDASTMVNPMGAGWAVVDRITKQKKVYAFTTPDIGSDMDSYIDKLSKMGMTPNGIMMRVKDLVEHARVVYRDLDSVKDEIEDARTSKAYAWQIFENVSDIIIRDMNERGRFYNDKNGFAWFFDQETSKLIKIEKDNSDMVVVINRYGINYGSKLFQPIIGALYTHALAEGQNVEIQHFSYFNKGSDADTSLVLYIYNGGSVFRITNSSISVVPNGADGVLFKHDKSFVPVHITADKITNFVHREGAKMSRFRALITSTIQIDESICEAPESVRLMFEAWVVGSFFGNMMESRPILAVLGEPGSGKTYTMRKILKLINGNSSAIITITNDNKDFDATLDSTAPIIVVDNIDGKQPKWFADRIASVVTGGVISVRKLYTNSDLVMIKPSAWIAVTAYKPHVLSRQDIADRLLIIPLERYKGDVTDEQFDNMLIEKARENTWCEILLMAMNVLREMYDNDGNPRNLIPPNVYHYRMRMFQNFTFALAKITDRADAAIDAFNMIHIEQTSLKISGNFMIDLLIEWACHRPATSPVINGMVARPAKEIVKAIVEYAKNNGVHIKSVPSSRSFMSLLKRSMALLHDTIGIEVTKTKGTLMYRFPRCGEYISRVKNIREDSGRIEETQKELEGYYDPGFADEEDLQW
jgi:hypothetical protein